MTLDTFVAGDSASMDNLAHTLRRLGEAITDTGGGWQQAHAQSAEDWVGPASEAFRNLATRSSEDANALTGLYEDLASSCLAWSAAIRTVNQHMEHARELARDAQLTVQATMIYAPKPPSLRRVPLGDATIPLYDAESANLSRAEQETAFTRARAIVEDARRIEQAAHAELAAELRANSATLDTLGQHLAWSRAATNAAQPVANALVQAASALETNVIEVPSAGKNSWYQP